MPRNAINPRSWDGNLRQQLKLEHGKGWSVAEQSGRIKLTRRDLDDNTRSSVMIDLPWGPPTTAREVLEAVATLRQRMDTRGISLRAAHDLNATAATVNGTVDWDAIQTRFLDSLKSRKGTTLGDVRRRVERTLQTLTTKPVPHDGKELMLRYEQQHLGELAPGSAGRRRNLQEVARFLTFAVEECDAPQQWLPLKGQKRRDLVGAADGRDATVTPPIKPEQLGALLDALDADGRHDLRLAVGLVGLLGLRPAELATLRLEGDRLLVGQVKRNSADMNKTAQEQARLKERRVLPLDLPTHPGLGAQLAAQWASGLVKLPPQIATAVAAGDLKRTGDALRQYLNRYQPWKALVATTPGLTPYSLRHGFAWRAHKAYARPLSVRDAAALMGHDPETHSKFYGRWTDEQGLLDAVAGLTGTAVSGALAAV
jgi:integrase